MAMQVSQTGKGQVGYVVPPIAVSDAPSNKGTRSSYFFRIWGELLTASRGTPPVPSPHPLSSASMASQCGSTIWLPSIKKREKGDENTR